jgi:MFS family permease
VFLRARAVGAVLRSATSNPALRRIGFSYALFGMAELGIWIALLIYAYGHGGTTAGTTMVLVQLVPCILLGPFLGAFADRHSAHHVLCWGYGLQALAMGGVAAAIAESAPIGVVFVLAPLTALGLCATRPAQAAVLPAVVRTADELTAANVMSGWTFGAASLMGPAVAGVLIAWHGVGLAVAVTAAMSVASLLLVAGLRTVPIADAPEPDPKTEGQERGWLRGGLVDLRSGTRANLDAIVRNAPLRMLLSVHAFYFVLIGAVDLLCVVLAATYLHMGPGGAGFLNASFGAGALLAGFVTAFLVGRRHLKNTLVVSLSVAVAALGLVSAISRVAPACILLAAVGLSGAVFDVTGRTLLQRSAPANAVAGLFSILEALMDLGLVLGTVLVQVAIAAGGLRAALLAPAVVAIVLVAALWKRLGKLDQGTTVPQVEIRLLRSIPIFAALPAPALEGVARELEPVTVSTGTTMFHEGDRGDRYYAVADGSLAISRSGVVVKTVSRGEGFGEIALIHDVPRRATVTAVSDASLYSLRKDFFLQAVTGHPAAALVAGRIVAGHLGNSTPGGDGPDIPTTQES